MPSSIAQLLAEQGRVLADQRRRSGERRGAVISELGQIPGQILADRAAQQRAQQQAAIQAEELQMRRNADQRANLASELAVGADARAQQTHEDARLAEQRGKEAVLGWMKKHAAELKPAEAARMQAILEMPGGTKHLVDALMKAPEGYTLSPGQKRFGADNQELASVPATPEKAPALTFNQPQPLRIGGRTVMTRAGSDGKIYDMKGAVIEGAETAQPYVPPSTAQPPQPSYQWAKGPDGVVRLMSPDEIRKLGASQPDTADMRNKEAGKKVAARAVTAVRDLGSKIITKIGPAQRADAIKRGTEAVFGSDPEFRTYQDSRMALAGTLAVEQQGARVSDADVKALWLPMVPDAYRDTKESNDLKWELIDLMRGSPGAGPLPANAAPKAPSGTPAEGTKGSVGGVPATWKTVNGKTGWYAD